MPLQPKPAPPAKAPSPLHFKDSPGHSASGSSSSSSGRSKHSSARSKISSGRRSRASSSRSSRHRQNYELMLRPRSIASIIGARSEEGDHCPGPSFCGVFGVQRGTQSCSQSWQVKGLT
eukprot:scaffold2793_cov19-Tisochrysis_lutea.AAC.3